jgi:hypothetical protein
MSDDPTEAARAAILTAMQDASGDATGHGTIRLRGSGGGASVPSAGSMSGTVGTVGHGRIRLLSGGDVAALSAAPPEPVGHGAIHLGRRPDTAVAQLFADASAAAKDDIIAVLTTGGREG